MDHNVEQPASDYEDEEQSHAHSATDSKDNDLGNEGLEDNLSIESKCNNIDHQEQHQWQPATFSYGANKHDANPDTILWMG